MVRGELFRLPAPRGGRGREQRGARYAVVVQSDRLVLSTVLVGPTSTRARGASFRPTIRVDGTATRVLVEQTTVVDRQPGAGVRLRAKRSVGVTFGGDRGLNSMLFSRHKLDMPSAEDALPGREAEIDRKSV